MTATSADAGSSPDDDPRRRRIGIFGGSFDPVHNAHLALARLAVDDLALDELIWLPVGQPWQKARRLAPAADREAMVRLAIAGEPRFCLSTSELRRAGPSYTVDTVRLLQAEEPAAADWFLLLGEDQYAGFHSWFGWRELSTRVTLAVAGRPGVLRTADPEVARLPQARLALPPMPLSSTEVRERIGAGRDIADLVPPPVARYIELHHLYRTPPQGPPPARS